MIARQLESIIRPLIGGGKAIIIRGARQVGKSTLLHWMLDGEPDVLWLNGDEPDVQDLFRNISPPRLRAFEFKWNNKKAGVKCPGAFAKAYPEADFSVITPKNIEGFLLRDLNGA